MVILSKPNEKTKVPLTMCIMIFLMIFFLNNDFGIGFIYNYSIVSLFILCNLLLDEKIYYTKMTLVYFFLSAVVILFSFLPNSIRDPESNNHAISVALFWICCALTKPNKMELVNAEKLILLFGFFVTIYIIVVKVFPNIYWDNIYPHLSVQTQKEAINLMKNYGYGVPIGGSAVYADYILALGLFICFGKLIGKDSQRKNRKILVILSVLFLLGMIIENRRGELLSTIFTILLMLLFSSNLPRIMSQSIFKLVGVIVILLGGVAFMYSQGMLDRYIDMFVGLSMKSGEGLEEVGNGRIALWVSAIKQFFESPLIGIGWNQFRANNTILYMEGVNVHNDYLQWLCETGIIGFTLISAPTFYLWAKTLNICRRSLKEKNLHCKEAKTCALVSFGIQNFFLLMHFMDPCFYKFIFWPMFSLSIMLINRSIYVESQRDILLWDKVLI